MFLVFSRNLKKAELQLKVATDTLEQVKLVYAKVKSQLDTVPKDDGTLFQKRKDLQKEVDLAKKTLAQQVRYVLYLPPCVCRVGYSVVTSAELVTLI